MIAPQIEVLTPRELAQQLGLEHFREWQTYHGTPIGRMSIGILLQTDAAFQAFWIERGEEQVLAFERILKEADFLDQRVVEFFEIPEKLWEFTDPTKTMRGWIEMRISLARAEYLHLVN